MAFNDRAGPAASAKDVRELLSLLNAAGHTDFRDARGPMGFNQRQAAGRFTRDEAAAFIELLQDQESRPPAGESASPRLPKADDAAQVIPTEVLAEELRRRGWTVTAPPT